MALDLDFWQKHVVLLRKCPEIRKQCKFPSEHSALLPWAARTTRQSPPGAVVPSLPGGLLVTLWPPVLAPWTILISFICVCRTCKHLLASAPAHNSLKPFFSIWGTDSGALLGTKMRKKGFRELQIPESSY